MDRAEFEAIREKVRARREAREAEADATWAENYAAMVERNGGPEAYFGPLTTYGTADQFLAALTKKTRG
ncbi:hypothetical protein HNP47_003213 [Brevundimonas vesicularis]|uniref:Uncharacterized protein n=1 Tax=Brevundimonas vesicularis TaxID=41276 RepID=A0A7W9L780_BREVE|nr:hypothetical protein [Brevundimonas vesicularis]